jgi:hypothetical protein
MILLEINRTRKILQLEFNFIHGLAKAMDYRLFFPNLTLLQVRKSREKSSKIKLCVRSC